MKNLRESTTNEKVINYHKAYYRPENLALIITGIIKPEQVFKALEGVQNKIKSKGLLPDYSRPWQVCHLFLFGRDNPSKEIQFCLRNRFIILLARYLSGL